VYENLLLDLDGTLTDPKEGITRSIQHALTALQLDVPTADELDWCIGPPLQAAFAALLKTEDPERIEEAIRIFRERFSTVGLFENVPYDGIPSTLAELQSMGLRLILATSKPHVFARRILEHFALTHYFEGIYGSELDGTHSNKAELIAHILNSEKIDPATTIMVGDRKHDIIGARANGIASAAVSYGFGTSDEIEKAAPDFIFDTFQDLASMLRAQNTTS
jgi:phosphoglycolate phosphatase